MKRFAIATLLSVLSAGVHAQTVTVGEQGLPMPSVSVEDADYRLGPGDLIEVTVFGVANFTHSLRISSAGTIKLPLLDVIKASGLTPAELEAQLASSLGSELIRNPQVSVFVREYRSQPVFVLGAVRSPGQYQVSLQLGIVDILTMAGGPAPNAGDEAIIQRRSPTGGPTEMIKIDLRALLEQGDLSLNVRVRGGDVINIQERPNRSVFILGEVNRAGAYQLPAKQELRVTQAFAWAGGPMKTAQMNKGSLVRYDGTGKREEIAVNFEDILKGKKEDFVVQANDIIFVPGSTMKSLGYSLLGMLPNTLTSLPYYIP
jgi:polysaccharide biosynthesis/export protein